MVTPIPAILSKQPFTTEEALVAGVPRHVLRGSRFVPLHVGRGVWGTRGADRDLQFWLAADRLALPPDAAISYVTGLELHGAPVSSVRRHWTTTTELKSTVDGVVLHRRTAGRVMLIDELPVLDPLRCLLDAALVSSTLDLVCAGDGLLAAGALTLREMRTVHSAYGAKRLRAAARLMRPGVESTRESSTRLMFAVAGLPEPELNLEIYDSFGDSVGRPDFLWRLFNVTAEYDGWYHERDADQRQKDILRTERFRRVGLEPVHLTSRDHGNPPELVRRVWRMLASHGYQGPAPQWDPVAWAQLVRPPRRRRWS